MYQHVYYEAKITARPLIGILTLEFHFYPFRSLPYSWTSWQLAVYLLPYLCIIYKLKQNFSCDIPLCFDLIFLCPSFPNLGPDLPFRGFAPAMIGHTILVRTPLYEWLARLRELCLTKHNTHKRQTNMRPTKLDPIFPKSDETADPRFRTRGHWNWLWYRNILWNKFHINYVGILYVGRIPSCDIILNRAMI